MTPFSFLKRRPDGRLGRFVELVWFARGTVPYTREKIAPTGSTVAIVVFGDPLLMTPDAGRGEPLRASKGVVIGPHVGPVVNEPLGETYALGVVTTPIGAEAALGIAPASLRGRAAPLSAWPRGEDMREALLASGSSEAQLARAVAHLEANLGPDPPGLGRAEEAVRLLEAQPTRPVADIAKTLGITHGHLDRELGRLVGLTPRALARLLRLRRFLAALDVDHDVPWADVAAELGWYDQAHLARDFKRHTGVTPTQYLAAQRSHDNLGGEPEDAAGFVPE